ncbi:GNAT family N-acetyltransferase [Isoptericola chiayiensis]|uniref:GNAT family N-acetyltransferase n=1 Tax=Isoptericola chiayiensis TaxID=579446 RepID=A0ABP8YJU5_9MICO|nr:GNAT family N-acetyltransferase [Isoptericola chiayiensis]NOW00570.1 ribosomal protein S18 acetylase RimI-like enzyme [Isoptericola chiayiensis]
MTVLIEPAGEADIGAGARLIAEAFRDDVVVRRVVPGDHDRVDRLTDVYTAALRTGACVSGAVDVARAGPGGPILGVAVWEGPHGRRDVLTELREVPRYLRALGLRYVPAVRARLARWARARPTTAHWYLADLAVTPAARGRGVGSALLEHRLRAVDAEARPAYLEATGPGNQRLYERFGFRDQGPLDDDGTPVAMWRPAGGQSCSTTAGS